jgi:hypothetical protein
MVYTLCTLLYADIYCLTLIKAKIPARPKSNVGIQEERKGDRIPDFPKEIKI